MNTQMSSSMQTILEKINEKINWNVTDIDIDSAYLIKWMPMIGPACLLFLFWPVIMSSMIALVYASGWIFWIFTSLAFGVVQFFYVIYQFCMICLDIIGLSILKTFATLRSRLSHYTSDWFFWLFLETKREQQLREKRHRRRDWRRQLYSVNNLTEYHQIEISEAEDKSTALPSSNSTMMSKVINRSKSCTHLNGIPLEPNMLPHSNSTGNINKYHDKYEDHDGEMEYHNLLEKHLGATGGRLIDTTKRLHEARLQSHKGLDSSSLKYILSAVVKRNHLSVDNLLLDDARSVDSSGQFALPKEAKETIHGYMDELQQCLNWIADSPTYTLASAASTASAATHNQQQQHKHYKHKNGIEDTRREANDLKDRIKFLHKLKQNTGCTALMLSGGGAQAMYHAGTIKALIEAEIYSQLTVISGTSGGSIIAAMCATKTSQELIKYVLVPNVSTNFMNTGQMKQNNIRWFPTFMEMGAYWMKHKLLVDSNDFQKCCDFYFADITFEEAFQRTGKHVCITVSASRASNGGGGAQRLLLNHISTPHVTISSAVRASCALPGVMAPAKLMAKDSEGNLEPFEVDGVEWIDGSVQADLPFRRISTLFNVSEYIVCQCNFHVVPFLNKAHHPNTRTLYWRVFQTFEWDIRSRVLNLSRLGLFPKIFGQDISKVFKQKYHGNLTLVPRFTVKQVFGLKSLSNPTLADMQIYLKYGQIAAFPYISVIKHMVRLENIIDTCIDRVETRLESIISDDMSLDGSATSSISRGFFRSSGIHRATKDTEMLEKENQKLEQENLALREKIQLLEQKLAIKSQDNDLHDGNQTNKSQTKTNDPQFWKNLLRL